MLRLTVRGSDNPSDQTALSETLTSSSSQLSLSPMSALDRIADSSQTARQVRKVPTTDIADAVRGRSALMVRCPCRSQGNHGIRVLASSSYQTFQLVRAPVAQL